MQPEKIIVRHSDQFACVDCYVATANGCDDSPPDWIPKYSAAMAELHADGLQLVNGDEARDNEFSSRPCDVCRVNLAGSRHHMVLLTSVDIAPFTRKQFDEVRDAYIVAALWSSLDDEGEPLDSGRDGDDIADDTRAAMADDCAQFLHEVRELEGVHALAAEQIGHDFWLTRNHHGAGFWDRGLGTLGTELTKFAHAYSGVDLYIGDDKKIHA